MICQAHVAQPHVRGQPPRRETISAVSNTTSAIDAAGEAADQEADHWPCGRFRLRAVVGVVVVVVRFCGAALRPVEHDPESLLAAERLDRALHEIVRRRAGLDDQDGAVDHRASRLASGSRPTGGVSMITQSNMSRASSRSRRMRADVSPAIGSEFGRPGRQQRQPLRDLADLHGARRRGGQPLGQPGGVVDLEHLVQRRAPQVGIDQQHGALVGFAERQRQIRGGQRLAFPWNGAERS